MVVAILGIVTAIAAPSLTSLIASQRIKAASSDIYVSLIRARSTAIQRNNNATLSPVTAGDWTSGWRIADPDNIGSFVESHSAITTITMTGPASVTYQSSGRIQGSTAPEFSISATGASIVRCVSIDLSGRPIQKSVAC